MILFKKSLILKIN